MELRWESENDALSSWGAPPVDFRLHLLINQLQILHCHLRGVELRPSALRAVGDAAWRGGRGGGSTAQGRKLHRELPDTSVIQGEGSSRIQWQRSH